ncbi:BLOC-1-related complex subunit 6 [Oryzias melastigma]|uniref:BLOC-1 related complex subunit 6 n=1 Tax=Oryzias melastigma TaxID=30732 RepID=A0A3B3D8M4_ORYME|nr:BLOC-1-related complex subunit 6 [Oryzias melastigma]
MSLSPVTGTEVPQTANGVATPFENGPHLSVKRGSSSLTGSDEASSLGNSENHVDVGSKDPDGETLSDAETDINGRTCNLSLSSPQTVDSSFTAENALHSKDTEILESSKTADEVLMWDSARRAESKHSNEHGGPVGADRRQTPPQRAEGGADSQDGEREKQDEEDDEKDENTWSYQHPGRTKDTELSRHYSSSAPGPSTSSSSTPPALLPSDDAPCPPHIMAQVWVRNVRGMQDSKSLDEISQACGGGSGARGGGRSGQSEGRRATISSALELEGTVSHEGDLTNFITKNLEQKIKMSSKPSLDCSDSDCSGPIYRSRGLSRRPADIPPIDATVLLDLQKHVQDVAHSVELMMRSLNGTIQNMTALSVGYIQTYRDSVDSLGESVDMSIKGMYTLMARCEELDRSMQPIHVLAAQIRDIKRTLDALEAMCK